jgi:tetratricopeptide (TPR) repeat protein
MRGFLVLFLLATGLGAWAQNSSTPDSSAPLQPPTQTVPATPASKPGQAKAPNLAPPRSDSVNVSALGDDLGESSSKDTQIDLSPPADDDKTHPRSEEAVRNAESFSDSGEVSEFHPWDPHKAAKDVEVGDFYFKHKNYVGAESRYREALYYKDNDAVATFRLAVCLEKMNRPDEAREEYESYLKILPYGPETAEAKKAVERLKNPAASAKPAK